MKIQTMMMNVKQKVKMKRKNKRGKCKIKNEIELFLYIYLSYTPLKNIDISNSFTKQNIMKLYNNYNIFFKCKTQESLHRTTQQPQTQLP